MKDVPRSGNDRPSRGAVPPWQYAVGAIVIFVGIVLSVTIYLVLHEQERERIVRDFDRASSDRIAAARKTLDLDLLTLEAVQAFYDGSVAVTRKEFHGFVNALIKDHASVCAIAWAPVGGDSESQAFAQAVGDQVTANAPTRQPDSRATRRAASQRESALRGRSTISFIEPDKLKSSMSGRDLSEMASCKEAMRRACDTGKLALSGLIELPETSGRATVWAFCPVYRSNVSQQTIEARRRDLKGYIVGILTPRWIVEEGLANLTPEGVDVELSDTTEPLKSDLLYVHRARFYKQSFTDEPQAMPSQAALRYAESFPVAGRQWTIACTITPQFIQMRTTWYPWISAVGVLLLGAFAGLYLIGITNRNIKTIQLADQLALTNQHLEEEIVERKQTEMALQQSERKLRLFAENTTDMIWTVDFEGRFIYASPSAEQQLGVTVEEMLHLTIRDIMTPSSFILAGKTLQGLADSAKKGEYHPAGTLELEMVQKNGRHVFCEVTYGGMYDESGQMLAVTGVSRDITERKLMEDKLREAKEAAEAATQAKSRFLAAMSHEIRTPMTAILGYTDLLFDPSISASTRNNYVATIRRSGEHLLALINDILDLSKIESGRMSLDIGQCNIVSLLADVASVVRPRAEQNGLCLTVDFQGKIPETISTDGFRLRQAIINLAGNAVKFTEKGRVRIVASFLEQDSACNNESSIHIQIIDTGIGIRKEVLPQLFQPFSQGDVSGNHHFGGTGLGLVISRHIARLLGGDLTVESMVGKGSTFTLKVPTGDLQGVHMLSLPVEIEQENGAHAWQSTKEQLRGVHILLAEDGYDNRELIRTVLHKAGATVETAENGRLAVEKAENEAFDLILMDMNMPEMDGYEATGLLRARNYSGPILALTANAMTEDRQRCCLAGCDEYLTKPIDRVLLVKTIVQYVRTGAAALSNDDVAKSNPSTET